MTGLVLELLLLPEAPTVCRSPQWVMGTADKLDKGPVLSTAVSKPDVRCRWVKNEPRQEGLGVHCEMGYGFI